MTFLPWLCCGDRGIFSDVPVASVLVIARLKAQIPLALICFKFVVQQAVRQMHNKHLHQIHMTINRGYP